MALKKVTASFWYGAARLFAEGLKLKVSYERYRDNRAAFRKRERVLGDPHSDVYFVDGYHGGVTFWDWIILPSGGTWITYNWPVVADSVIKRVLEKPDLAAVFELDAQTFAYMQADFPKAVRRLKEALATGRLEVVNGTYAQPLAYTYDGETYVRHFFYGLKETYTVLEREVETYASQEPAFFPQLPQILKSFNFRLAVFRTHWAPFGTDPSHPDTLIKWRAPDGSWIWTIPRYPFMDYGKGEGSGITMHYGQASPDYFMGAHLLPRGFAGYNEAGLKRFQSLSQEAGMDRPLLTRLEDFNVLSGAPLKGVGVLAANENVHLVTFQQYLERFEADLSGQMSGAEGVYFSSDQIPCHFPWGLQGGAPLEMTQRASRRLLEAERLEALSRLRGGTGCRGELEKAWKSALQSHHHDLHLCGPWFSRLHSTPMSEVAYDLASSAVEKAEAVIGRAVEEIFQCHVIAEHDGVGQCTFVVFNSLPHPRKEAAYLPLKGAEPIMEWKAFVQGKEMPSQWLPESGPGGFLVLILDLPAFGGILVDVFGKPGEVKHPEPNAGVTERLSFTNPYYRALLNRSGSLNIEGRDGEGAVESGYFTVWDGGRHYDSRSGQTAVFQVSAGPVARIYAIEGQVGGIPFVQKYTFYSGLPRVEASIAFDFGTGRFFGPQKEESNRDNAYYVQHERKLNLNVAAPGIDSLLAGSIYQVEQRESENFAAAGFVSIGGPDRPSWSLLRPGACGYRWEKDSGLLQSVLAWAPREWLYASDDSIRVGGSQYTLLRGMHCYGYALAVGPAEAGALVRAAGDFENPFIVRRISGAGRIPESSSGLLEINPEAPSLTALFAWDGKTYLRFCNYGSQGKELYLIRGGRQLRPVNLKLEPEGSPRDRAVLEPGRIQTFELTGQQITRGVHR